MNPSSTQSIINSAIPSSYNPSQNQSLMSPTPVPQPSSAAVVNSKSATTDLNNIRNMTTAVSSGMQTQAFNVAQAQATAKAQADAAAQKSAADKAAADKLAIDKQTADAKTAALGGNVNQDQGTPQVGSVQYDIANGLPVGTSSQAGYKPASTSSASSVLDSTIAARDAKQAEYDLQAKTASDAIANISNGVIPLSPAEQAQVDGLKQSYQQLIQAQGLQNKTDIGLGNIRGFQKGAAEYDPTFQAKTISSIVTGGLNKISDLNVQMASAVAKLTDGFKNGKIAAIKDAYSMYKDASDKRLETLNKTIADTQKAIQDANDLKQKQEEAIQKAKEQAAKDHYDQVIKPINDVMEDAAKNGATPEQLAAIQAAKTPAEAIAAAGDSLQTGAGSVGEYLYYKKQAQAAGQVPLSFDDYQTRDANRKAKIAAAAAGAGYSNAVTGKILQVAGQFDSEPQVKSFQVVAEAKSTLDSIPNDTKNPSDDQALIYAFAKVMDPNSVVREGEYNTVQKYSQSWANQLGKSISQAAAGTGFLSEEARKNIKATIDRKYQTAKRSYDSVYNSYGDKINKVSGGRDGTDFITDYSKGYSGTGADMVQSEDAAKSSVISVSKSNPKAAAAVQGALKDGKSYADIISIFPEYFK